MTEGSCVAMARESAKRGINELRADVKFYRKTLELLSTGKGVTWDCTARQDAFLDAIPVLDGAVSSFSKGDDEFARFKFGNDFRAELEGRFGHQGEVLFYLWRDDASFTLSLGGCTFTLAETGAFPDAFYGGIVKGMPTCVDPHNNSFHVGGIIGTIELPWVKQVVATLPNEREFVFRRRVFLVDGGDHPIMAIQPIYHGLADTDSGIVNAALIDALKRKYDGKAEVREMPPAMLSHEVKTHDYPEGINTGYSTFRSGRSPLFYIDSNCHSWRVADCCLARNGLHGRRHGEEARFPRGWSSEHQILPEHLR